MPWGPSRVLSKPRSQASSSEPSRPAKPRRAFLSPHPASLSLSRCHTLIGVNFVHGYAPAFRRVPDT